ncbi:MAG: phage shock protein PspA [Planctomycetota bacterium]|jgi:phage shock protein A|nr:phage shock protein PspA [Planctomycetota bacterium]
MGIFTRLRDIINSNINNMLDHAEDPEKMVKLMITEMEDTLVEIKASCANTIASKKKVERMLNEATKLAENWGQKAELAIEKGREDLAREALNQKHSYLERVSTFESELTQFDLLVEEYRNDIQALEEKLDSARDKQRILVQRQIHAQRKHRAQSDIRRYDASDALLRFEQFEHKIDRLEAEAELVNVPGKPTLEDELAGLEYGDKVEEELASLKASIKKESADSESAS